MKKSLVAFTLASAIIGNCVSLSNAITTQEKMRLMNRNAQIVKKRMEQVCARRQYSYEESVRIVQERQDKAHAKLKRRAKSAPAGVVHVQQTGKKPSVKKRSNMVEPTVPVVPVILLTPINPLSPDQTRTALREAPELESLDREPVAQGRRKLQRSRSDGNVTSIKSRIPKFYSDKKRRPTAKEIEQQSNLELEKIDRWERFIAEGKKSKLPCKRDNVSLSDRDSISEF
ncbi:MAG: hypothetical protein LBS38_02585 [Endomicrobium sp.]|jgi:hypothetical protein|nr:hypothetical protein [Endomicrobium sp.]